VRTGACRRLPSLAREALTPSLLATAGIDPSALRVGQGRGLVVLKGAGLRLALFGERFDELSDQARQIALGVCGVLAPDDMIRDETQVVADEDLGAEGDADRKGLVVAIPEAHRVGIAGVGTAQRQQAEIAQSVLGDTVMLFDHLMAVERQGVHEHVHYFEAAPDTSRGAVAICVRQRATRHHAEERYMQTSEEWYVQYFDTQLNCEVETRRMRNLGAVLSQARDFERLGHRLHSIVGPTGETPWERIKKDLRRRAVLLCSSFARNLAFYRAGQNQGRHLLDASENTASFWRQANSNFY
jgi:hypothetical protein